jgi:hypothetical protein
MPNSDSLILKAYQVTVPDSAAARVRPLSRKAPSSAPLPSLASKRASTASRTVTFHSFVTGTETPVPVKSASNAGSVLPQHASTFCPEGKSRCSPVIAANSPVKSSKQGPQASRWAAIPG